MPRAHGRESLHLVIAGHVDHGKSTVIGRLLADTGSLPEGRIEQVRALCTRTGRPFEYAFLLDALQDERTQGITIDAARVFFSTRDRDYLIVDAPGHIEFLKNMITGAARAEAALLVIDAQEGIRENSRRHGYMMSMLGIRQVAVLINKMDLVSRDASAFHELAAEYGSFLARVGVAPAAFIPVSGRDGDNIAARSGAMDWYAGPTVLDVLATFRGPEPDVESPFRLPVQDVYKFTGHQDDRRIVAGTVASGSARVGDELIFAPSGKRATIRSFEAFNAEAPAVVVAGQAVGLTLREQIYVSRGEVAALASQAGPAVGRRFRVSLFWLGHTPLTRDREYILRLGTSRTAMRVEAVHRVVNASDLATDETRGHVDRHEVAECTIETSRALAADPVARLTVTGRFVIVDGYEISGGGIIREMLADRQAAVRQRVMQRNAKWEPSFIAPDRRARRFAQRPTLLLVTGSTAGESRKALARRLEARLFDEGRLVYFLGIGNILYGVDSDLGRTSADREEHLRRLAEIANLMLDAGVILIVTAASLTGDELSLIGTAVDPDRIECLWIGDPAGAPVESDFVMSEASAADDGPDRVYDWMQQRGILFRP
jgi:bifunctional enzyme CysN/CysC